MKNKDGELNYPKEQWTDIAPPDGLYAPIHFDGKNGWVHRMKNGWNNSLKLK